jgi:FlaA1/EpsC-like NDP-sugar epimerase
MDARSDLKPYIQKHKITDIILAKTSLTPAEKSDFLQKTLDMNIRVKEMMPINNMFSKFNLDKLTTLDINDLMNREPIRLYGEHIANYLKGKSALVTGAAGSIGSEIVRKLAEHHVSPVICVDFSESALYDMEQELTSKYPNQTFRFILADIRNEEMMDLIFRKYSPHMVYHAAAYKHVPMMEQYPWQAIHTNVLGTEIVARKAIEFKAERFVFISSDKAVNPTSVMGATKRLAEVMIKSMANKSHSTLFAVTRFGNVLGSNGSVVPLFRKQIQQGGPVTVTHPDMTRYFMTIAEACQLVLEASVMSVGGEIFVFDMGKPVKILDLAKNMIRLAGFMPGSDIKISFTGLRPGEKMFEDLFSEMEKMKDTYHEKIMISHASTQEFPDAEVILLRLQSLENVYEPALYRKVISDILPEYAPEQLSEEVIKIKTTTAVSNPLGISNIASVNK